MISACGIVPSPFDCYLVTRSVKTLHLRMDQHMKNGLAVARFLESHPAVDSVLHPGNQITQIFKTENLYILPKVPR